MILSMHGSIPITERIEVFTHILCLDPRDTRREEAEACKPSNITIHPPLPVKQRSDRQTVFVVTFCRNILSLFPRFPVFSGHEIRIFSHSKMRLIILKRKELTDRSGKMWERKGTVGQLTLDQHIGVRIPGGQPIRIKHLPLE